MSAVPPSEADLAAKAAAMKKVETKTGGDGFDEKMYKTAWDNSGADAKKVAETLGLTAVPKDYDEYISFCKAGKFKDEFFETVEMRVQKKLTDLASIATKTGGTEEILAKLTKLEDDFHAKGKIHRIVITGGPCAGKSTIMADLLQMLKENNYLVFTMPEIATEMYKWSDGKMWDDFMAQGVEDDPVWASLQSNMTRVQMVVEDSILQMAQRSLAKRRRSENPPNGAVIILDRGVVDNVAYNTPEAWNLVLQELGTTTTRLRDGRYDHVIHLVSAALGAEKFYTLVQAEDGTTSARTETLEEACELDLKTREAWRGARNHYIVGNDDCDFDQKRQKVMDIINTKILGEKGIQQSLFRNITCEALPCHTIKEFAISDQDIPWVVTVKICKTLLSSTTRLMKQVHEDASAQYFYQSLDAQGHVERKYQVDWWTYTQKLNTVELSRKAALQDAGSPASHSALKEVHEDRVIFPYKNNLVRCKLKHLAEGEKLVAHVSGSGDISQLLPRWLKST